MPRSPCSASTLFSTTLVEPVLVRVAADFLADIARFADADDDDLAALAQTLHDQFDRLRKSAIKLRSHRFEGGDLDVKNFTGPGQMTHTPRMLRLTGTSNNEGRKCRAACVAQIFRSGDILVAHSAIYVLFQGLSHELERRRLGRPNLQGGGPLV